MTIFKNSLLGLDLFLSTLTGGIPGETLSGRAGTAQIQGKLKGKIYSAIINLIMWNSQHCKQAIQGDINRAMAVIKDDTK